MEAHAEAMLPRNPPHKARTSGQKHAQHVLGQTIHAQVKTHKPYTFQGLETLNPKP